uniref:Uncharacterized protein LOC117346151 isoform X3 n=1 Tax=Geotrypetes seraphini TaxID=260995 RepID=A0A6P8N7G7_GEOSA|nr:uncharacterized protein LOC117346151 isoform X3 [Geotrypetes seraphini]
MSEGNPTLAQGAGRREATLTGEDLEFVGCMKQSHKNIRSCLHWVRPEVHRAQRSAPAAAHQVLPLRLWERDLLRLNRMIHKFCWAGKKSKLRFPFLLGTWDFGGLGLPDLKLYNAACLFQHVMDWLHSTDVYSPLELERAFVVPYHFNSLLQVPR